MTIDLTDEKTQAVNFSLYPVDIEDIEQKALDTGVRGRSAALRIILAEWRKWRELLQADTPIKTGARL